ncbi:hypothetical protein LX32DRAFT_725437 [Colletotrichum zoysiae]|uniref:Uncharacterized protein n=1 Tax=Colletotrichum zoysiae TaxID=1216348 RepID=A0AAD9M3J0_9PEZI|nr:hypothetical protein LX32DRAFT_725437 [Colletotrichum zoysiae]
MQEYEDDLPAGRDTNMKVSAILIITAASATLAAPVAAPDPGVAPAPVQSYSSYGTYNNTPPAYGSYSPYSNYGAYKRAVEWVKSFFQ